MSAIAGDVLQFATQFRNGVIARARGHVGSESTDDVAFHEEAFTELFIDALAETGAISEGHVCHFVRKVGNAIARVDGYYTDEEEEGRLDLFVSLYDGHEVPAVVPRDDVLRAVKQALTFVKLATSGAHEQMEPSDVAYGMLHRVHELRADIRELRIFVLTDGLAKEFTGSKAIKPKGMSLAIHVWDIERLSRCYASGGAKEPIEVDFVKEFGGAVPCLPVKVAGASYRSYLAVLPGEVLHRLYEEYGERLLELNVRSFLQARGKINKEIRRTILEEPRQFFAFNNGVTAIAEDVKTKQLETGGVGIAWLRGLQIVNGGQTTASLHRAAKKDGAADQLRSIFVQTKLSVIQPALIDEMVPRISLYANSQNKVNEADFSANDPFHQQLERLSRSMWTPDGQSHWFYERARGQYQVARAREGRTAAATKKFDAINPPGQMFSKTDLAVFEHSWDQLPHLVSRGSQKNFREYTIRLAHRSPAPVPDDSYFRDLVAKAILFKAVQTAARRAEIGAYRANIVTYSVAYLSLRLGRGADLRGIWERQSVPQALQGAIERLLEPVGALIVQGAGTRNVTEYCKREECWKLVAGQNIDLGVDVVSLSRRRRSSQPGVPEIGAAISVAAELGVEYIDHTEQGGALWLLDSPGSEELPRRLKDLGFSPSFAAGGARATAGRPAWYVKAS